MDEYFTETNTKQECSNLQKYANMSNTEKKMLHPAKLSLQSHIKNKYYTITKDNRAASNHYFESRDKAILKNIRQNNPPTTTILPSHSYIQTNDQENLLIPALSDSATNTNIFKNLNYRVISLGQLCDDHCVGVLTQDTLVVNKNNKQILRGQQGTTGDGLRDIPFPQNNTSHF